MAVREPLKPISRDSLGWRLRKLRKDKGYTLTDVAKFLNMKGPSLISNYETNYREPDLRTIKMFANFYNVSMQFLTTGEEPEITQEMLDLVERIKGLSDKDRKMLTVVLGD